MDFETPTAENDPWVGNLFGQDLQDITAAKESDVDFDVFATSKVHVFPLASSCFHDEDSEEILLDEIVSPTNTNHDFPRSRSGYLQTQCSKQLEFSQIQRRSFRRPATSPKRQYRHLPKRKLIRSRESLHSRSHSRLGTSVGSSRRQARMRLASAASSPNLSGLRMIGTADFSVSSISDLPDVEPHQVYSYRFWSMQDVPIRALQFYGPLVDAILKGSVNRTKLILREIRTKLPPEMQKWLANLHDEDGNTAAHLAAKCCKNVLSKNTRVVMGMFRSIGTNFRKRNASGDSVADVVNRKIKKRVERQVSVGQSAAISSMQFLFDSDEDSGTESNLISHGPATGAANSNATSYASSPKRLSETPNRRVTKVDFDMTDFAAPPSSPSAFAGKNLVDLFSKRNSAKIAAGKFRSVLGHLRVETGKATLHESPASPSKKPVWNRNQTILATKKLKRRKTTVLEPANELVETDFTEEAAPERDQTSSESGTNFVSTVMAAKFHRAMMTRLKDFRDHDDSAFYREFASTPTHMHTKNDNVGKRFWRNRTPESKARRITICTTQETLEQAVWDEDYAKYAHKRKITTVIHRIRSLLYNSKGRLPHMKLRPTRMTTYNLDFLPKTHEIEDARYVARYQLSKKVPNVIEQDQMHALIEIFQNIDVTSCGLINSHEIAAYYQPLATATTSNINEDVDVIYRVLRRKKHPRRNDDINANQWLTFWNLICINYEDGLIRDFIQEYKHRTTIFKNDVLVPLFEF